MKMALIIYGNLDILSGGYLYDRKLVEYLRSQGDQVEILSLRWRNYAAHVSDNLTVRLPPGYDLVIEDELNHPSLIGANRRPHPYPVIALVHHLRSSERRPAWQNGFYRWLEVRYLQSVDGFIFNSETTAGVVHGLVGSAKPYVVAFPPTDRFGDGISEAEIRHRATGDPFRIVFVGNIIPRKGLLTLLEAMRILNREGDPALRSPFGDFAGQPPGAKRVRGLRVDIVGSLENDSVYAKSMQRFVTTHDLSSMIHFHGPLNETPLAALLREAHLLVVPSTYEGYGIAYLEGMGFGLPAIGTTSGAAGEIITEDETGYLIPPADAPKLAERIVALAHDRQLLTRLSLNALQRFRSQPRWEQTAGTIRSFLQMVLSMRQAKADRYGTKHRGH